MSQIKDGIEILLKYGDGSTAAEHDEIYAGPDGKMVADISDEDCKALEILGWFWDERYDCWRHFT